MKYIIPQDKIDKVVFKYLDLKHFEEKKPKFYVGIIFANPDDSFGTLGLQNDGTLFIYYELIDEISINFGTQYELTSTSSKNAYT